MSFNSEALPIKSAAGIELGGNGSLLITDKSIGGFGLGAGLQGSIFATFWKDHPIAAKLRIESVSLQEEAIQKANADFVQTGALMKSLTQKWTLLSVGAEGNFQGEGQTFFWEALLGYAIGGPSTFTVTTNQAGGPFSDANPSTASGLALSGGVGIKRVFSPKVTGIMTVRSLIFLGSTYGTDPFANKMFMPLPLMFNVGAEVPFDFLH